jgi:glycosyltransferase involved in cell wall biosynthesis
MAVRTSHEHHSAYSGPYQFLRHLDPDAFEISNVTVPLGSDLVEDTEDAREMEQMARALGLDGFAPQGNAWLAEWDIAARLRREPFDLVHFLDGELGGWLVTGLPDAFFRPGRPRFLSLFHQPPELLERMISRPLLGRFAAVGTVSEHQAAWLRGLLPGRDVHAVPHGIDVDFFCPRRPTPARTEGAPLRLLAVGRWLRDYETAFAALRRVAGSFAIEYRIVGHDPDAAAPEFVTPLSGLSDEALREEYRAADVLFMPLTSATANNALMESMACGTPVITTAVGGVPEYVDETCGRLCPRDADALAAAAMELLGDAALRERLGRNARARAESFDWRRIAERFAGIYRAHAAMGDGEVAGVAA